MDSRYRNRDFHAPQLGLTGMLTPPDNCPSLGLAFTAEFAQRVPGYPPCFVQGNAALDGLPDGCNGCTEDLGGQIRCCQEIDDEAAHKS